MSETMSSEPASPSNSTTQRRWIFNLIIGILFLVVVYFSYSLYTNHVATSAESQGSGFTPLGKPIQVDVLNGCGVAGAAAKISTRLRQRGFDVVEIRNYKSFDIRETLVIDRVGNLHQALQVASALGVGRENVIQEINFDYYVDVTVVIGKDFQSLH
jgi:hypothetical protein